MEKKIEAAPVARDENGFWCHPDLPKFGESDGDEYRAWVEHQQLKVHRVDMEDDASDELNRRVMESDIGATADWTPTSPGADWFLLTIHDTDDGPVAWFAYRATDVGACVIKVAEMFNSSNHRTTLKEPGEQI